MVQTHNCRRGSVLVLAALCLILIFAFTAFVVDVGYICSTRAQLQNAADAAALAAAQATTDGSSVARNAAISVAGSHTAAGSAVTVSAADVVFGNWNTKTASFSTLTGSAESQAGAVRVTARMAQAQGTPLNLFFAPLIGVNTADVSVTSTAKVKNTYCGKIIGLNAVVMSASSHTDSYNSSQGAYMPGTAGNQGHMCSNGIITMSGSATINGNAKPGVGCSVKTSGTAGVTGTVQALKKPMSYPAVDPGSAATVNDNGKMPLTFLGKDPLNNKNEFNMSGSDSIDLPPGTYYFAKLSMSGTTCMRISGPTVIYCTGDIALSGATLSNASKIPSDLQLFPMGTKCDVSGSSELYAVIYGPGTNVIRSGGADYYGTIVGLTLNLSGEGGIHADDAVNMSQGATSTKGQLVQ